MPFYDLKCSCGEEFNIMASMSDRENNRIRCPKCGNDKLEAIFSKVNIVRSRKSSPNECPNAHRCGSGGCCSRG